MPKFIDRAGQRYGRLIAIKRVGTTKSKKPLWECVCDCGNVTNVNSTSLTTGNTTSCGCYLKERITKHGGWNKSSYNTWRAMMRRCYNPDDKDYKKYGALGVTVYAPWHDYSTFAKDVGEPTGAETFDRIDTTGSYTPENCRWASLSVQARNVRVRNKFGAPGIKLTASGKFMACLTLGKKSFYSACFATVPEAIAARKELERLHWGAA